MLAYDYPLLGLFWTMFILFIWVAWLVLVFRIFVDIFRSDMSGVAKAAWSLFVILLPFLGVLIYVVVHGNSMKERDLEQARASNEAFQAYVRETAGAGGASTADELSKLASLRDSGAITDDEFATQKAKLLA